MIFLLSWAVNMWHLDFIYIHVQFYVFQGQLCDYCDPSKPEQNHSIAYAIDGTERWWQSPPLSRGNEFNEVHIVINLEQVQLSDPQFLLKIAHFYSQ